MASGPITSWEIDGETVETVADFIFLGSKITADGDCSHEIKRHLLLGRKVMTNLDSLLKSRDITLPTKVHLVKATVFSSGHEWMWELDYKEGWAQKNWCFWTVMLEKSLMFTGKTGVEAETPILWPPDEKNWLTGKVLMLGKIDDKRRRGRQRMRWLEDITNSRSSLRLTSVESVMPSSHLILCRPLLLLPPIPSSINSI